MTRPWDTNNPLLVQIFSSALTGIIASPDFHSGLYQQSPRAAVEFADSVVLAALTPQPEQLQGEEQ